MARGHGRGAVAVRARRRRPRRPARLPRVRDRPAADPARTARSCTTSTATCATTTTSSEEAGRRATANRLLDLIGAHVPERAPARRRLRARPAARRGARARLRDASGWSCSREAARARARRSASTCASCRWRPSARARNGDSPGEFDAIVLADVLEHLDDPVAAIDQLRAPAAPAAACCASSRRTRRRATAKLAGARWWGYLPAHTVLLPRRTLRELISARGLVISADVPFVRTFAARALGRRAGGAARAAERAAERAPPERHAAVPDQPLARRRARDPRPPHAGAAPARAAAAQHRRPRAGARRPARLQRGAHDPGRGRARCPSRPPTARC